MFVVFTKTKRREEILRHRSNVTQTCFVAVVIPGLDRYAYKTFQHTSAINRSKVGFHIAVAGDGRAAGAAWDGQRIVHDHFATAGLVCNNQIPHSFAVTATS